MSTLSVVNGRVVADRVEVARSPLRRARGLIGQPPLEPREALVIEGARQVHTFGMRYPLAVAFCDGEWTVRHVVDPMAPRRVSRWVRSARWAIEMRAGALDGIGVGERLALVKD